MVEIWKDIEGYEGHYQVSSLGRIKSLKCNKEKILRPAPNGKGYLMVSLCNIQPKNKFVHRLVAIAYISNPENKPTVNHKRGNKLDNRACALEWATHSENQLHSFRELGRIPTWLGKFGKDSPRGK